MGLGLREETIGLELRLSGFCLWISAFFVLGIFFARGSNGVFSGRLVTMIRLGVRRRCTTTAESDCVRLGMEREGCEVDDGKRVLCLERVIAPGGARMKPSLID